MQMVFCTRNASLFVVVGAKKHQSSEGIYTVYLVKTEWERNFGHII